MKRNVVVGLGEVLWDLLPSGKRLGGAPANFAYHSSQFGNEGIVASAVGNDLLGDGIVGLLSEKKVGMQVAHVDYPTGTVGVKVDADGIPTYDIREGVAWDNIPFTAELEQLARRTDAVCFGSLAQRSPTSRSSILRFLDAMPVSALKIFDINLRAHYYSREVVMGSLERCNILKINDEELTVLADMSGLGSMGLEESCSSLMERFGLRYVIVTCGVKGSYVASPTEFNFEPTPKVHVNDTVGAGDSFAAAFCSAVLAGKLMAESHRFAVEVAAYVCSCCGAMPEMPRELVAKFGIQNVL